MGDCRGPTAEFRHTFRSRSADDQRTLEMLTAWAERLCNEDVAELAFGESPAGRDRWLAICPPGQTALLHVVNSDTGHHVNVYSYSYGSLGPDRFLEERLGGSRKALAALERAESLADGEKLWITSFSSPTLDALRDLLVLARDRAQGSARSST